jgi:glycerol-3-phosphate acyltransferase PlsY
MMLTWLVFLVAYLLGSIPSAYIASRLVVGKDIRTLGNGNMGAKNTFHSVGWLAGVAVAAVDIAKGALAIQVARAVAASEGAILIAGACAVLGHDWPVFAHFRGGQGMAAIVGVFGMLFPRETILALCAFGLAVALSRNWDLGCAAGFILLVGLLWAWGQPPQRFLYPFFVLPTIAARKFVQKWQHRHAAA